MVKIYRGRDVPVLGDSVYLGPGAKIFGNVMISDGCKVGANAVVNKSCIQKDTVLVGVPAQRKGL